MEQQQPRPDHVVVDIELQAVDVAGDGGDASQRNAVDVVVKPLPTGDIADCRVVDMNLLHVPSVVVGNPTAGSPDCHVADAAAKPGGAKRDGAGSDDDDGSSCCVVCTEPLEWVVVGRCGHRVVCGRCMVRIRFFHQDKRCCVCRTRCPKVLVTRWDAAAAASRGAGNNLPALPRFAFREGRVGKYWYHKLTAAYFEDEQQYDVARAACHGILSAFHQPLVWFIIWFVCAILMGAGMGFSFASQTKHWWLQVSAYALTILCVVVLAAFIWSIPKWTQNPLEVESSRKVDEER